MSTSSRVMRLNLIRKRVIALLAIEWQVLKVTSY
uniref:Uncharacterized protein n=1 Tax=Siphoviridae sp. ctAJN10 TaxID=2826181 RepID=A0A8S5M4F8_9CAUD|nr:MAG TPA: hypothetical protein [Siphoviridae sp. ctAJN10]